MTEQIIDKSKIIIREPQIYVGGVYCKTKRQQQFYKTFGAVATICGVIGALGVVALFSYIFITY